MSKIKWMSAAVIAGSCVFAAQAAMAYGAGDFFVRGGFAKVEPESDNGRALSQDLDVSDENGFTYGFGYLFHDKIGVELNGTEKFEHDLTLGGADIGSVDRMPVNLLVNYYPLGGLDSRVQPYVGAGVNYTRFSGEELSGLNVRRSYGAVGQVGVDLAVTENFMFNGFANYADVDADVRLNGTEVGEAKVDPLTIGGGVTFRF
ncbi:outer membrane protein OprG [Litchfieldella qijiaojingensis]|uniref:Outer membrane protein OprG n=1 Tax=Litchfieldella qijiaojingensis TaxID=980347 RepID=A0ABQ2YW77_9GAMM|nr:OmpW family outer membrane protein [Halomonas qijiaojingensis]GGX95327.1 outer membrane protein OprG [Halomonas qijiaojingensis]